MIGLRKFNQKSGFALVASLSLMAFIVLIALALSTLLHVSIRSSAVTLNNERARNNAKLALMIAVGDLQRSLGADQRVTATANIAAGTDGNFVVTGETPQNNKNLDGTEKGISAVLSGTRYWTGVFINQDKPDEIYQKTPSVNLMEWLVSGKSHFNTQPTPADASFSVGSEGKVVDASKAILLVGPNSVGEGAASLDRYVAAPRVLVSVDSDDASKSSGAYAYWVGDEGVKARINTQRSKNDSDAVSLLPQRRAWETVSGFEEYPIPGEEDWLSKVLSLSDLNFGLPSVDDGVGVTPLKSIFHSATTFSRGLLVNTHEGGTRVDLTGLLSGTLPPNPPDNSYPNYPVADGRVIEASAFPDLEHLTWDHVRDFYQTSTDLDGVIKVREAGENRNVIAPTITDLRLLFGVKLSDAVMEPDSTDQYTANVHLVAKIAVTLSNPYSVPLEWDEPLELEIKNNRRPGGGAPLTVYSYNYSRDKVTSFQVYNTHYLPTALDDSERNPASRAAVLNRAMFQIPAGRLEPGEAIAYSHAGSHSRSSDSTPFEDFIVGLEPIDVTLLEYGKSLEMTIGRYLFPRGGLQIRAGETSRAVVELRDSASDGILRRIKDLELNNPYRRDTVSREFDVEKVFNSDGTQKFNGAVPLLLYKFQLSQPGEQYEGYSTFEMGLLGSTLRTYTDFNLRGTDFHNPIQSYNPPPFFMEIIDSKSDLDWYDDVGGETGPAFTQNFVYDKTAQFWGYNQTDGTRKAVFYSFPSQFVSLAQLQHADMTQDAVTRSIGHQPGHAFGNSYATPFVQRRLTQQDRTDYDLRPYDNDLQITRSYYDISYMLNSAIWDRYFFSSLSPDTGLPENPALVPLTDVSQSTLNDPNLAATGLLVDGAFNINSTEKEAWKAFLGSSRYFQHPADDSAEEAAAFPRSLEQPQSYQEIPSGKSADSYAGYRRLSESELDAFATEMVRQVRLRGPFVSLSHFVNRALAEITEAPELSRSGALQTALDESDGSGTAINMNIEGDLNEFSELETTSDRVRLQGANGSPAVDIPATGNTDTYDWVNLGVASILADPEMLSGDGSGDLAREQGYRSTGIPGWITQADVLQVIGPAISARSDTFRIRTAGQSMNESGDVEATAYLEAIVQRVPEYVDSSDAAHQRVDLKPDNESYGRKFKIIYFRWLSKDEI